MQFSRFSIGLVLPGVLLTIALCTETVQAQSFIDVPAGDFSYEAVEYLLAKGIIERPAHEKFFPGRTINRAEALKLIAAPQMTEDEKKVMTPIQGLRDVPEGSWYLPYLLWAGKKGSIVDLPPKSSTFQGGRAVKKAEFLKMLFLGYDVDPNLHSDVKLALSSDVTSTTTWFYPFIRYGVSSSVLFLPVSGKYNPGRDLTREDAVVLLHRFLLYREGQRTQELLSEARSTIESTLASLEKGEIQAAEQASARALLMARGAQAKKPDEAVTKVALKTAESIRALVRAYRAGLDGNTDQVITLSSDAWGLADEARKISPGASTLAVQLQTYAKSFADTARAAKKR